jgi:hypothetical protein
MAGKSIRDENVRVLLFSDADYRKWIDDNNADDFATSMPSQHEDLLARREVLKAVNPAFKIRDKGKVTVVVNAEHPFADVLSSLAHELGHAKQDFVSPIQTIGGQSHELTGIQEAQAQQFERAFWLTIESRLGKPVMSYPEDPAFDAYVESIFEGRLADYQDEEHALGYLIQWLAVLQDPELLDLRSQLATEGALDAESSLDLFDYLLTINPSEAPVYVQGLLDSLDSMLPSILDSARGRTVADLAKDLEGPPELRSPALTSP